MVDINYGEILFSDQVLDLIEKYAFFICKIEFLWNHFGDKVCALLFFKFLFKSNMIFFILLY